MTSTPASAGATGPSSETSPPASSNSFGGDYVDLVPNERLTYTDSFEAGALPGEMRTTVTLKPVSVGTEMTVVQDGVPTRSRSKAATCGWQQSLANLARLVEPNIPQ